MKQKLLLLFTLFSCIAFANPKSKATANPSIGILLSSNFGPGDIFTISIKNTGEETLTNIYVTDMFNNNMSFNFGTFASLAPGEDLTNLYGFGSITGCATISQVMIHATPSSDPNEIIDLSSDPNGYDNNGLPGTYYNDIPTYSYYTNYISGSQQGIYQDTNNNSIPDVGDVVNYTYFVSANNPTDGLIVDDNAIIANADFYNSTSHTTTGIHYITAEEAALGYVYNSSYTVGFGPCAQGNPFYDESPCSCPNPSSANIITPLTSNLPNQISGTVQFNTNNDNCSTGVFFINRRVSTTSGAYTYSSYTNSTGGYNILIPSVGNYSTSVLSNLNANFSSNPTATTVTSSGSGVDYNNTDFCVSSATNYADLRVNMFNVNQAMPGEMASYRIYYANNGSTYLNGSITLTFDNGKLIAPGSLPSPNSASTNSLTWNFTNLLPFQNRYIYVDFTVLTPPTVNPNDLLPFTVVANPIAGDADITNNTFSFNQPVRSSFDPNDKTVIEGSTITTAQTGNFLNYITRFQNTGNADATTVVIKETLDPNLDWNTFEPIDSSHASNIQIRNGNEITYTFSNISLPYESANEPASHGWMAYRIKPRSNVVVGDIMGSQSDIYFDYNLPITTNTVNTQVTALSVSENLMSNFSVYPNPADHFIIIESKNDLESDYEITDINGKSLLKGITRSLAPIDINAIQSGFYFMTLKTNQGKAVFKFIKS